MFGALTSKSAFSLEKMRRKSDFPIYRRMGSCFDLNEPLLFIKNMEYIDLEEIADELNLKIEVVPPEKSNFPTQDIGIILICGGIIGLILSYLDAKRRGNDTD